MGYPNTFHSGGWKLNISNIPLMTKTSDMKYFDNYCTAIVVPDYNIMEYISSGPEGETERHPINRINEDLTQLQVDFKISEDFKNYLYLFQWMLSLRYREIDTSRDPRLWQNTIDRITLTLLDNQKEEIGSIYFTEARLISMSSIALDHGAETEVSFTSSFSYREIGFELK